MNPKRPRGRPRTLDRERTVQDAMEHYWRDGPLALSVNEICRRTEMPKPSLYRDFGGDDGLLAAALARYEEVIIAPLVASVAGSRSFAEATDTMIAFITSPLVQAQGCLFVKMQGASEHLGPVTSAHVASLVLKLRGVYSKVFEDAQKRGELRVEVSPELAGRYLDTQVTSALRQVASGEDPEEVRAQIRLAFAGLR